MNPAVSYSPSPNDLAVVLCHFNPVGWKTTPRHLYDVCDMLVKSGVSPTVVQLVRPPAVMARLPSGVKNVVYKSQSVLFRKENLWNLGAMMTKEPKILFLDGDITFSREDALGAVSEALDNLDVIQPFSECVWLSKNGDPLLSMPSSAMALKAGIHPKEDKHHPGFSWAMRRDFFVRCGGFYERCPIGGGDSTFAFSMSHQQENMNFVETKHYSKYRKIMLDLKPRVGCIDGTAYHLWHGSRENRLYEERMKFMPKMVDGEYPIIKREDGLLEWSNPSHSLKVLSYLIYRMEDD